MQEEKKIKLGKLCNKIATVLFVLFFIDTCVIVTWNVTAYIVSVIVIMLLFSICCIVAHHCLKDYKPE